MLATDDVQLEGHTTHYPLPMREERPSAYAERLGNWYANLVPPGHKKKLGQYLTSTTLAEFMASLVTGPDLPQISVLDPGAGAGILSCALCENLA